jgi:hypothetical protein
MGTYGFAYSGAHGIGIGVFTISDEQFRGVDFVGGRYEGTARENADGTIALDITFDVSPGIMLAQGTAAQDAPYSRPIKQTLRQNFADAGPIEIVAPPGKLYVMLRRVPDNWARGVDQGISVSQFVKLQPHGRLQPHGA